MVVVGYIYVNLKDVIGYYFGSFKNEVDKVKKEGE